ncbi:CLL_collapsed_G0029370.mRNA.1.CDS.1 [Saccharomyces cerevisiae]|nr:CLL_collapsed_G0029370.mRNA.1.CDS.1 [Saccharomyces cerevisiae]
MAAKHQEMDSILKSIYDEVLEHEDDDDTLICVLGDHGMNELGNHGGSSAGETSAGLLFLSPKLAQFARPESQVNYTLPINASGLNQYLRPTGLLPHHSSTVCGANPRNRLANNT